MKLFYSTLEFPLPESARNWAKDHLNNHEFGRLCAYRMKADFDRSIIGKLLLSWGLVQMGESKLELNSMAYNEFKKPLFPQQGYLDFNISHSENVVAVGLATGKGKTVGVDVENIREIELKHYLDFFHSREISWIGDDQERFFEVWTKKEAALKALGTGMYTSLKNFNILDLPLSMGQENFWIENIAINNTLDYKLAIASNQPFTEIPKAIRIPLSQLIQKFQLS